MLYSIQCLFYAEVVLDKSWICEFHEQGARLEIQKYRTKYKSLYQWWDMLITWNNDLFRWSTITLICNQSWTKWIADFNLSSTLFHRKQWLSSPPCILWATKWCHWEGKLSYSWDHSSTYWLDTTHLIWYLFGAMYLQWDR